MNLKIEEKFNNFVNIIENKEKMEWLKQINTTKDNSPFTKFDGFNENDCSCKISSGLESYSNFNNSTCNKSNINSEKKSMSKHKSSEKGYELSLLEDDYFIGNTFNSNPILTFTNNNLNTIKNNETNKIKNNVSEKIETNHINSEFQNIFLINDNPMISKKIIKNESSEIKGKLENIYNKVIKKNNISTKPSGYKISDYIDINNMINEKNIDITIKKLSILIEYAYNESTRGWNYEQNLYILSIEKLKENFEKIIFPNEQCANLIKMGFIYRDYNENKVYLEKDFTKYWIGFNVDSKNLNKNSLIKYTIRDKVLFYCLKNLTKLNKFKKKISKINYKFIKKTIQIQGNKNLIMDIILFIGIKI